MHIWTYLIQDVINANLLACEHLFPCVSIHQLACEDIFSLKICKRKSLGWGNDADSERLSKM